MAGAVGEPWTLEETAKLLTLMGLHYREVAQHFPTRTVTAVQIRMAEMRKRMGYARRPGMRKRSDRLAGGHVLTGTGHQPVMAPMMGLMGADLTAEQVDTAKQFLRVLWHAGDVGRRNGWPVDVGNVIVAFRQGVVG